MEELALNSPFWRGKRVLVTGHTGFKGGWLSLWLQQLGAVVTGYALAPPTQPNLFEAARVGERMQSLEGDVRDAAAVRQAVEGAAPEIVFHLAAQPLVRSSYDDPVETYSINLMGTVHLLDALRISRGVRAVVIVTTDKCYENEERLHGYCEGDRLGGHDPYSNSKACAELAAQCYRDSFFSPARYAEHGVGLATARAGNVIGGGDWAVDRLLPDVLRAMGRENPMLLRNPRATRPWQHVLDALSGYLKLAEALWADGANYAQAWNFGPLETDVREVAWIVEEYQRQLGLPPRWRAAEGNHLHETQRLQLNCAKARVHLKWLPRWDVSTALRETARWHQAQLNVQDMHAITLTQIHGYMKVMSA